MQSVVFHSLNAAKESLYKCADKHLLMEVLKPLKSLERTPPELPGGSHPFIVLEGIDGTGKTTLAMKLAERIGAVRYFTPPASISYLRSEFDKQPETVRRAYYSLGNYEVAMQIVKTCARKPVVMDRFWHTTAAYAMFQQLSHGFQLPSAGSPLYDWPSDLLRPSFVIMLTVSERVRLERMAIRGLDETPEELKLKADKAKRKLLLDAYKRMANPGCVMLSADRCQDDVLQDALSLLAEHGFISGQISFSKQFSLLPHLNVMRSG